MSQVYAINFTDLRLALELGAPLRPLLQAQDLWWDPDEPYEAHALRSCGQNPHRADLSAVPRIDQAVARCPLCLPTHPLWEVFGAVEEVLVTARIINEHPSARTAPIDDLATAVARRDADVRNRGRRPLPPCPAMPAGLAAWIAHRETVHTQVLESWRTSVADRWNECPRPALGHRWTVFPNPAGVLLVPQPVPQLRRALATWPVVAAAGNWVLTQAPIATAEPDWMHSSALVPLDVVRPTDDAGALGVAFEQVAAHTASVAPVARDLWAVARAIVA